MEEKEGIFIFCCLAGEGKKNGIVISSSLLFCLKM